MAARGARAAAGNASDWISVRWVSCGTCGGGMSIKGRDRGGTRIVCTAYQNVRACTNNRTYYQHAIDDTVLSGLRRHLVDPRAIRHFLKVYHEERKRLAGNAASLRPALERRLGELTRRAARLTGARLSEQLPKITLVAPCSGEKVQSGSQVTWAS